MWDGKTLGEKINELVDKVNNLSKPVETTKEQPLFSNKELDFLISKLNPSYLQQRVLKEKLERLKV